MFIQSGAVDLILAILGCLHWGHQSHFRINDFVIAHL